MDTTTRKLKLATLVVVALALLACGARELLARRLIHLGVDFPSSWTPVQRAILWQRPNDICLQEPATDELAHTLRWLNGFKVFYTISSQEISPDFFHELGVKESVERVVLAKEITDAQLAMLDVFPNLQVLEIVEGPISCDSLPILPHLEKVDLSGPVSKIGAARIARLPSLRKLSIDACELDREDIKNLLANPSLKELWLDECVGITEADKQSLQALRPDVTLLLGD